MPIQPSKCSENRRRWAAFESSAAQVNDRVNTAKILCVIRHQYEQSEECSSRSPINDLFNDRTSKEKHLFFLDGRTIGKSVAGK